MAGTQVILQVRAGMEVRTADDGKLGKVTQVWCGTDPDANTPFCDDELCSRVEVQQRGAVLYIPSNMLDRVSGRWVVLKVKAAEVQEHDWYRPPSWILGETELSKLGRTDPLHT